MGDPVMLVAFYYIAIRGRLEWSAGWQVPPAAGVNNLADYDCCHRGHGDGGSASEV